MSAVLASFSSSSEYLNITSVLFKNAFFQLSVMTHCSHMLYVISHTAHALCSAFGAQALLLYNYCSYQ